MVTRSCTQRQFLLRPDAETNNAIIYCLALAARHAGVIVLMTIWESNHHHTVIYDPHGRCSEFVEHLHKLVGRSQNRLRGRWGNLWESEEPCVTELVDAADVIARLVYAAANPVKDHLVERAHEWPGVSGYMNLLEGRVMHAVRPRHFFREKGGLPAEVTLELTIPHELGSADEVVAAVRKGVELVEQEALAQRRRTKTRVLGRARILSQLWTEAPTTERAHRKLRPRFAARDEVSRVAALTGYRIFLAAYREARLRWKRGIDAVFPAGTYWLRRFAAVTVEPLRSPT